MSNLLFTICARAGSKGVKNKNIKAFNGYALVYYTLSVYKDFLKQHSKEYENIHLAVNTDSKELIKQIEPTTISVSFIPRKAELAGDAVGKMDVILDTLTSMEKQNNIMYEYIIDLDLTSPIRTVADVRETLRLVEDDQYADIAYSVVESRRSPYFNMVCLQENGYYDRVIDSDFVSRQQVPICYDMNASIYAYRRGYLQRFQTSSKRKALIWKMEDTGILDIDSEEDYELLQLIYAYLQNKNDYYKLLNKAIEKV